MYKKTKIVATISDMRCDVGLIQRLYDAGMNVVRLNTAHQDAVGMKRVIDNVREVSSHLAIQKAQKFVLPRPNNPLNIIRAIS